MFRWYISDISREQSTIFLATIRIMQNQLCWRSDLCRGSDWESGIGSKNWFRCKYGDLRLCLAVWRGHQSGCCLGFSCFQYKFLPLLIFFFLFCSLSFVLCSFSLLPPDCFFLFWPSVSSFAFCSFSLLPSVCFFLFCPSEASLGFFLFFWVPESLEFSTSFALFFCAFSRCIRYLISSFLSAEKMFWNSIRENQCDHVYFVHPSPDISVNILTDVSANYWQISWSEMYKLYAFHPFLVNKYFMCRKFSRYQARHSSEILPNTQNTVHRRG